MKKTVYPNVPAVGITGSFGKSTVKEVTDKILSVRYNTFSSKKNNNTNKHMRRHAGEITDEHEAIVLEMAMNKKSYGLTKCRAVQPNIGVIASVGHAHFIYHNSIQDVVESKSQIIKYMHPKGTLYLNYDDEYSQLIDTKYFSGTVVQCGVSKGADYRATDIQSIDGGQEFNVELNNINERMFVPLLGEHNVINALFGVAIADKLNFTPDEIRQGLNNVEPPSGRLMLMHLEGNRQLLDDSKNANPAAVIAALKTLHENISSPKKIAVLGDMAELGSFNKEGHEKVGKSLTKFEFDRVYIYGEESKYTLEKAIESGYPEEKLMYFRDLDKLIEEIKNAFKKDTAILVKASAATNFKKVIEHLLSDYKKVT